jgi:hypothetical protein
MRPLPSCESTSVTETEIRRALTAGAQNMNIGEVLLIEESPRSLRLPCTKASQGVAHLLSEQARVENLISPHLDQVLYSRWANLCGSPHQRRLRGGEAPRKQHLLGVSDDAGGLAVQSGGGLWAPHGA